VRCRRCNYGLWNIRDRVCPECGDPFMPSEYEFTKNAVRFLCPHCRQDYYGQGAKGHLSPRRFECVSCAATIDMDEMVLMPTEGCDEDVTEPDLMPWRHRARIGYVKAWFMTVAKALFTPPVLMRLDPGPSVGAAWAFFLITLVVYAVPGGLIFLPFILMGSGFTPSQDSFIALGIFFGMLLVAPILTLLAWASISHAILRLTGPTEHSIGGTYQCFCYAAAADVFKAVPCFNVYFFWLGTIWWGVSATLMVSERQRVGGGRAALAVVAPLAVVFALGVAAIFTGFYYTMQSAQATMVAAGAQGPVAKAAVIAGTFEIFQEMNGRMPDHGLELVSALDLDPDALTLDMSFTQTINIPVGTRTIEDFAAAGPEEQAALLEEAIAALPDGVIAHRLGDVVFTYHGIDDLDEPDPGLWIMVASPDPRLQQWGRMGLQATVVHLDGTTESLDARAFANALDLQNVLREEAGLAPLPHPDAVSHEAPATGD